jgi:hypothetical protein
MIVRALDSNGDWLFGKGRNDYRSGVLAIGQNIQTRLAMFLGDCFFATQTGIDWWNLLGGKNPVGLQLSIQTTIINTNNVTGLKQLSFSLSENRVFEAQFQVQTALSTSLASTFSYDFGTLVG